jgi:hypothetical protein
MTVAVAAVSAAFAIYGATEYRFTTAILPVVAGCVAALASLTRLPGEIAGYVEYRRSKRHLAELLEPQLSAAESSSPLAGVDAGADGVVMTKQRVVIPVKDKAWGINGQYTREAFGLGLFGLLIGLCWVFGFVWGVPMFVFGYGLFATRRVFLNVRTRLIFTVISTAVMYGTAYEMLNILHLTFTPVINF